MMNDFSSIIQLLATLTVGFVILDYSDFFTKILKIKFFYADDAITKAKNECSSIIPDKASRDILQPINVGDGNTSTQIEKLKRECEKTLGKIDDFEGKCKTDLDKMSDLRSLASICLYIFMSMTVLLFIPGLRHQYGCIVDVFIVPFSMFSVFYIILGWIFGEKPHEWKCLRFESLKHPVFGFVMVVIISVLLAIFNLVPYSWILLWKYVFVVLIVVGWINFGVYALIIRISVRKFRRLVDNGKKTLLEECKNLRHTYDDLITVNKVAKTASDLDSE